MSDIVGKGKRRFNIKIRANYGKQRVTPINVLNSKSTIQGRKNLRRELTFEQDVRKLGGFRVKRKPDKKIKDSKDVKQVLDLKDKTLNQYSGKNFSEAGGDGGERFLDEDKLKKDKDLKKEVKKDEKNDNKFANVYNPAQAGKYAAGKEKQKKLKSYGVNLV